MISLQVRKISFSVELCLCSDIEKLTAHDLLIFFPY